MPFLPLYRQQFLCTVYSMCTDISQFPWKNQKAAKTRQFQSHSTFHTGDLMGHKGATYVVYASIIALKRRRQWGIKSHKKAQSDLGQRCPIKLKHAHYQDDSGCLMYTKKTNKVSAF